jgi:hypothetical protein
MLIPLRVADGGVLHRGSWCVLALKYVETGGRFKSGCGRAGIGAVAGSYGGKEFSLRSRNLFVMR